MEKRHSRIKSTKFVRVPDHASPSLCCLRETLTLKRRGLRGTVGDYSNASRNHFMFFLLRSKNGAKIESSATRPLSRRGARLQVQSPDGRIRPTAVKLTWAVANDKVIRATVKRSFSVASSSIARMHRDYETAMFRKYHPLTTRAR